MDTKVEPPQQYNIACLIKDKTQETAAGNVSNRFNPSFTLRAAILKPHFLWDGQ